jgi:GNAT superfamily N-acetyltransferase
MMRSVVTRDLGANDWPLLARATLGNLNWSEERFTERDLDSRSEFRRYTQLVPERADFGFVAERAEDVVGVVWALLLPAEDPGYGFLDESTPEVCLWVRKDSRGNGVGRRQLQREAVARRIGRLSLSVEADNPAKRLYASEGFTQVGADQAGLMLWIS